MTNNCFACGNEIEDNYLATLQDVNVQSTRMDIQVGDKVRLKNKGDWIIDEEAEAIISEIDGDTATLTFHYQTPFDLKSLKEHERLSVSGGPTKRVPVEELERTSEIAKTTLYKHSPNYSGHTPPTVKIYSQIWMLDRGDQQ